MKKIIILLLFIIIPFVFANEVSNERETINKIIFAYTLDITSERGKVSSGQLEVWNTLLNLSNSEQQVIDIETYPTSEITKTDRLNNNKSFYFRWSYIDENDKLKYNISYKIKTKSKFKKIIKTVNYPIPYPNQSFKKYIKFDKITDKNIQIEEIANRLAKGEDDLYVITYKIADWVYKNINYSKGNIDPTEKSSLVIDKYNGTVDGANNLFASLLRSAGIPIRFVHGTIIYPDTLRGVYHLWTEVYFPSYGWVPFDVALNQIGYVDYYHVKWAESDSAELLSSLCGNYFYWYSKSGYNMNRDCYVYSEFESIPDKNDFNIQIDAKLLENIISEDSYNLMRIDIKNPDNFYVTIPLKVKMKGESIFDDLILLKPNEQQFIYIKFDDKDNMSEFDLHIPSDDFKRLMIFPIKVKKGSDINCTEDYIDKIIDNKIKFEEADCGEKQVYYIRTINWFKNLFS